MRLVKLITAIAMALAIVIIILNALINAQSQQAAIIPTVVSPIVRNTPSLGEQNEVAEYVAQVRPIAGDLSRVLASLTVDSAADLSTAAGRAKAKDAASATKAEMVEIAAKLATLVPPKRASDFHSCFSRALDLYIQASSRTQVGMERGDIEILNDGVSSLRAAREQMEICLPRLEALIRMTANTD